MDNPICIFMAICNTKSNITNEKVDRDSHIILISYLIGRNKPDVMCHVGFYNKRGENLEITIVQGEIKYLDDCLEALMNSELASIYLPDEKVARNHLIEAFERKEMYLALDREGKCIGYIRFVLNGIFYNFPYVCNIAVKENFRTRGIGKRLLEFFEDIGFIHSDKVFLLVSSFNKRAKKLYESIG